MSYTRRLKSEVSTVQGDGRGKALAIVSAGSLLVTGVQMVFPVLLPELRNAFSFDLATGGLLLSVLWVAYAAGQMPGGILTDRIGDGRTMFVGTVLVTAMLFGIVTSTSVGTLFGATIGLGLGAGFYGVSRFTVMEEMYPDRVGTTIGIVLSAADAGQALLPPVASFLAVYVFWQAGFAYTVPLFALVCLGIWHYVPTGSSRLRQDSSLLSRERIRAIGYGIGTVTVAYGVALFTIYASTWVAFTSLYPTYLVEVKGVSSTTAAVLFGSFFGLGVVVKPLAGALYDRFGVRVTLASISLVSGAALVAIPFTDSVWQLAGVTVLVAPILGSGTIAQSYLLEQLSDEVRGVGFGLIRTGGMGVAGVTPAVFGVFAEVGRFDEVFVILAGLAGLLMVLAVMSPRTAG